MELYSAILDVASALAAPGSCPACGSGLAPASVVGDDVTVTCLSCERSWRLELGHLLAIEHECRAVPQPHESS